MKTMNNTIWGSFKVQFRKDRRLRALKELRSSDSETEESIARLKSERNFKRTKNLTKTHNNISIVIESINKAQNLDELVSVYLDFMCKEDQACNIDDMKRICNMMKAVYVILSKSSSERNEIECDILNSFTQFYGKFVLDFIQRVADSREFISTSDFYTAITNYYLCNLHKLKEDISLEDEIDECTQEEQEIKK